MSYKMIHSCIRVMDLEKSERFYQRPLGLLLQDVRIILNTSSPSVIYVPPGVILSWN